MLNNKIKNKLFLSILIGLNIFSIYAAPAIVVQSNGVETVLNLRQTIPERVQLAWKRLDPSIKNTITAAAYTLVITAIVMRMQAGQLSQDDIKVEKTSEFKAKSDNLVGLDKAKQQLRRCFNYIRNPEPYNKIGAKPIKGVLLHGPPGNGKTDLARTVAQESGLNFISVDGSKFNGIWRGSGVAKVGSLHKLAKANSPCVVFIDEIDGAVGSANASGISSCDADNQATTNAFKTMIDGFNKQDPKKPIFFMAATNNLKNIDPAITRDGRLTPIYVGPPSIEGLSKIFKIKLYDNEVKSEKNIDTLYLANCLPAGSTGANVEAVVNEAAFIAGENNKELVDLDSLKLAISERG